MFFFFSSSIVLLFLDHMKGTPVVYFVYFLCKFRARSDAMSHLVNLTRLINVAIFLTLINLTLLKVW